jgi:hypothetical protein
MSQLVLLLTIPMHAQSGSEYGGCKYGMAYYDYRYKTVPSTGNYTRLEYTVCVVTNAYVYSGGRPMWPWVVNVVVTVTPNVARDWRVTTGGVGDPYGPTQSAQIMPYKNTFYANVGGVSINPQNMDMDIYGTYQWSLQVSATATSRGGVGVVVGYSWSEVVPKIQVRIKYAYPNNVQWVQVINTRDGDNYAKWTWIWGYSILTLVDPSARSSTYYLGGAGHFWQRCYMPLCTPNYDAAGTAIGVMFVW